MNRNRVIELVSALRSGKYTQIRGVMKRDSGYCALGLACEVSGVGKWGDKKVLLGYPYIVNGEENEAALPLEVKDHYGFCVKEECRMAEMNDLESLSFSHIADYLEQEVEREQK